MAQLENMAKIGFAEIWPLNTVTVPPYTTTNTIVYGDESFVVIDPGSTDHDQLQIFMDSLAARRALGKNFLAILLTHHHGDHSKGALPIAKKFGVPIMAHVNARHHLNFAIDKDIHDQDIVVEDDYLCLQARYTPGHADDHMVYYDARNGCLIAGDMITDKGAVLIPPSHGDLATYLNSLNSLTTLQLTVVIPAHGQPIIEKPNQFLLKAMRHRYERIHAVSHALVKAGGEARDATDITHAVYGRSIPDAVLVFAQLSVESSLHWLQNVGLVENRAHRWYAVENSLAEQAILDSLKQIDERLRLQEKIA